MTAGVLFFIVFLSLALVLGVAARGGSKGRAGGHGYYDSSTNNYGMGYTGSSDSGSSGGGDCSPSSSGDSGGGGGDCGGGGGGE